MQGESTSAELQRVQADKQRLELQVQQSLTAAVESQQNLQKQLQQQAQQAQALLTVLQDCFGFGSELQATLQTAQGEALAIALHDMLAAVSHCPSTLYQCLEVCLVDI